jgi:SAM-dependent methyltransferase
MILDLKRRARNRGRALLLSYGTEGIKKSLWNAEYSEGRWDNLAQTHGDCLYPYLEQYGNHGSILDLGCGSGNTGSELSADAYHDYTGVDISNVAIEQARKRAEEDGRTEKNRYLVNDIFSYKPARPFDVILFRESIYYCPAPKIKKMLQRYATFLEPGGVFIVRLWSGRGGYENFVDIIEANFEIVEKNVSGPSETVVLVFR